MMRWAADHTVKRNLLWKWSMICFWCCRYFARLGRGQISVYETPDCGLLDKKSIKLENVQDFSWSPNEPVIAAYQSEQSSGNLPARIVLLQIPEKTELRQKNLFSVSGMSYIPLSCSFCICTILWPCARHEVIQKPVCNCNKRDRPVCSYNKRDRPCTGVHKDEPAGLILQSTQFEQDGK